MKLYSENASSNTFFEASLPIYLLEMQQSMIENK